MHKKVYQTGTMTFSEVEQGQLGNLLANKSKEGWALKTTQRYFSKDAQEDGLLWILERTGI